VRRLHFFDFALVELAKCRISLVMQILIIGPGCSRCKTLAQLTEQAVRELGVSAEISKVTDLKQIMALGVMMTPALAVNGTIKLAGRVPTLEEIKKLLV
jgi:small redox-active disulfide protein 2